MTEVYVVVGTTGENADRSEWLVCAYSTEELAIAHAAAAEREAKRVEAATGRYAHKADDQARVWDAAMSIDYTGTDYTVVR